MTSEPTAVSTETGPSPLRSARPVSRLAIDATDIARIAVFAAFIAVLGLPGGFAVFGSVPITAQTLGVMLAGAILGAWRGAIALVVFLALVALGLPLLAGGHGGAGVFVGPTAGYLIGWIAGAFVVGAIVHAGRRRLTWARTILGVLAGGILVIYAVGLPVQSLVTRIPLPETALQSLVFIPGDLVKAVIAVAITMTLQRAYPRAFRTDRFAAGSSPESPESSVSSPSSSGVAPR